jgi:NTE family protein
MTGDAQADRARADARAGRTGAEGRPPVPADGTGGDGTRAGGELALVMSGGGARAAYQVGCLAHLIEAFPDLRIHILTGVSAGAINAVFLAAHRGGLRARSEALVDLWSHLAIEDVFESSFWRLARRALGWGGRLSSGGHYSPDGSDLRGMVDTGPLWKTLQRALSVEGLRVPGIAENLAEGTPSALSVTASSYSTGQTVTWVQGRDIELWERDNRISEHCEIGVEHIMASAALPIFFPAVQVHGRWYGDGGLRLTSPLAPAIHLGARRILVVSTRSGHLPPPGPGDRCVFDPYPTPATVAGALLNSVFLDQLDADALRMQRINRLLPFVPDDQRRQLRPIELEVIRPSRDLGVLANEYESQLPRTFRFLTRGLGTRETRSNTLLSLLMFQGDYLRAMIELGREDAKRREAELAAFLGPTVPA